ncbi:S24/S26 family peptidase [uncultured Alistipes sp.]|uniref:S24/S26 family peptidase n=1 Tax=uncultured Alistipes sp. TaxID=538949 RepID=UPI0028053B68|nr:S24/S26 family peptidase [uncultured Alistipes sp.]
MKISTELRPTQNGPEPRTKPRPAAEPRSGTVAETGRLPKSKAHSAPNGTRIDTPAGGSNPLLFGLVCELLREGREVTVRVEGESMLPLFRSGSRIRIHPLRPEELRRGSVVLGETDSGHFVIHRIVAVDGPVILLQGDGNLIRREALPRERIHGAVDCSPLRQLLARIWCALGPLRRYPLQLLRKVDRARQNRLR